MRALPGRASRTSLGEPPATLTRAAASADQRRRILRAAGELVAKRGYNAVTVELIVKRAKVSFKTFYAQFAGKEECFLELFDTVVARGRSQIQDALVAAGEVPWPQQVVIALEQLFATILADPILARACIVEAPTVGPVIVERYEGVMKALAPLIKLGRQAAPEAAQLPATLEDTLAGGVLWSAYQRLIVGEVDRIEALVPEAIEFVLRPYLGEGEAARWARWSQEQTNAPVSVTP